MENDQSSDNMPMRIPGYRLVNAIGEGGMGQVFLAVQESLERPVAIKVLNKQAVIELNLSARFEREANLMAKASHANVVPVIDKGVVDGQLYIVMEYLSGGNLRSRLQAGKPLPVAEAQPLLLSIGRAVSALHDKNIIHRDLKPENVLLDEYGTARITDFGIALPPDQIGRLTADNMIAGTFEYMAPEQQCRLTVDARADQYALAFIAYEVLTGRRPLGVVGPPSDHNSRLTKDVDAVILRGLQEDPDDRFPTVAAFTRSLDQSLTKSRRLRARCQSTVGQWGRSLAKVATVPAFGIGFNPRRRAIGLALILLIGAFGLGGVLRHYGNYVPAGASNDQKAIDNARLLEQIGTLAYRERDGSVEVLLVRTRSDSHWTVPKATRGREATVGQTVAAEAFEEAGVRGDPLAVPVGSYFYKREGNRYRVTVYALHVQAEFASWPEDERKREWFQTEDAAKLVASEQLGKVIREFEPNDRATLGTDADVAHRQK